LSRYGCPKVADQRYKIYAAKKNQVTKNYHATHSKCSSFEIGLKRCEIDTPAKRMAHPMGIVTDLLTPTEGSAIGVESYVI
jgi:hypothetical protein